MIHELRTYRLRSSPLMKHMHARMEQRMLPLFEDHQMRVNGAWEMLVGRDMPTYIYMLEWNDMGERQAKFDEFYLDPRVEQMRSETVATAGDEFVRDFDVALLRPAPYLDWTGRPAIPPQKGKAS